MLIPSIDLQGGKIVYEKGFGVRELGKKAPVTPNTLFRIASMTKPLTSLLRPYPSDQLEAFPVSPRVNSPNNDDPECIAPLAVQASLL